MSIFKKASIAATAGATLLALSFGVVFADTVTVTDNGAGSHNLVNDSNTQVTVVEQTNYASVVNNVSSDASTGGNKANGNTGGDVNVSTGGADVTVVVDNTLNKNTATVDPCCTEGGPSTDVTVEGNGVWSKNTVNVGSESLTEVGQQNAANVVNNVDADAKTGGNQASLNTGEGNSVSVETGGSSVGVGVTTVGNLNEATVANCCQGGTTDVVVKDNGVFSKNTVNLLTGTASSLLQSNFACVVNLVGVKSTTGGNKTNWNTGGSVSVSTGPASLLVSLLTKLNKNVAN